MDKETEIASVTEDPLNRTPAFRRSSGSRGMWVAGEGSPARLFVGGLHGREGAVVEPLMRRIGDIEPLTGRTVVCLLTRRTRYMSTLKPEFYRTRPGRRVLELIRLLKPSIYLEIHSYSSRRYGDLTDPERQTKIGVPALIDLGGGLLIGSVSPIIRTSEFGRDDFCFTLEVPADGGCLGEALEFCRIVAMSADRAAIMNALRKSHPAQVQRAETNFRRFYRELEPF